MAEGLSGPFAKCGIRSDTDSNSTTYSNHPSKIFGWLQDGIAYSGKGITHTTYFAILFMLAGKSFLLILITKITAKNRPFFEIRLLVILRQNFVSELFEIITDLRGVVSSKTDRWGQIDELAPVSFKITYRSPLIHNHLGLVPPSKLRI